VREKRVPKILGKTEDCVVRVGLVCRTICKRVCVRRTYKEEEGRSVAKQATTVLGATNGSGRRIGIWGKQQNVPAKNVSNVDGPIATQLGGGKRNTTKLGDRTVRKCRSKRTH